MGIPLHFQGAVQILGRGGGGEGDTSVLGLDEREGKKGRAPHPTSVSLRGGGCGQLDLVRVGGGDCEIIRQQQLLKNKAESSSQP